MARESDGGELWPMQRATSNEQRATSNEQRATSNQQPATSNQQPALLCARGPRYVPTANQSKDWCSPLSSIISAAPSQQV
ncbi:hypothetical protein ACMFMG_003201 [Clarireedia jacksonii]